MQTEHILLLVASFWVWFQVKRAIPSPKFHLATAIFTVLEVALAYTGFFQEINRQPVRMALLLGPGIAFTIWLFMTHSGRVWRSNWRTDAIVLVHVARLPVEFMLLELALSGLVPFAMTMKGYNFDVISGLTAPLAYFLYLNYRKDKIFVVFKYWNWICLILLGIVVITGILSAPTPFQMLNLDQPNKGILMAPFNLLPAWIVPWVLISHLHALNLKDKRTKTER